MPWIRLDDQFPDHPKIVAAGPMAGWLFVCGLSYAARYLTDGFIPATQVRRLADLDGAMDLAQRLVDAGLWEACEGGYRIHDYLEYQPSAEQVRAERDIRATRKALYADPFLVQQVRKRDQDHCRYCGRDVRWTDRKSNGGGTYDHVIPDAGNSLDNLVVACRGCNSRKGKRTPEQAGMAVLPPSTGFRSDLNPGSKKSSPESASRTRPIPVVGSKEPTTPLPPKATNGAAPKGEPSPSSDDFDSFIPTYSKMLSKTFEKVVGSFRSLDPTITEGWIKTALVEAERQAGPLPRDKLQAGLHVAYAGLERAIAAERDGGKKIGSVRGLTRSVIIESLKEQAADAHVA